MLPYHLILFWFSVMFDMGVIKEEESKKRKKIVLTLFNKFFLIFQESLSGKIMYFEIIIKIITKLKYKMKE